MLSPGDRVGDYEIEAELGEGGMARVYRARHTVLDTTHAVKVLEPKYRADPETRERFLAEAKIQAKHLDHPNIVRVTNIVATADHAALVMELVDGPDLEELAGKIKDPDQIKEIFAGILAGVGSAHARKIIHRDLKPANVLLDQKPDGSFLPKVTDFGVAKVAQSEGDRKKRSTHADARMGTLHYMSPEQIRRAKDVTERSDIFSLGAMLYELVTGAVPFDGDSDFDIMDKIVRGDFVPPGERVKKLDPVIDEVIQKALCPDPAERFASCEEMAAALAGTSRKAAAIAAVVASTLRAATPTPVPAANAGATGRRAGGIVVVVAGVALAAGAVAFYLMRNPGPKPASGPKTASTPGVTVAVDGGAQLVPLATYDPATGVLTPTDEHISIGVAIPDAGMAERLKIETAADGTLVARLERARPPDAGPSRIEILSRPADPPSRLDSLALSAPPPCSGSFRSAEGLNIRVTGIRGSCGSFGFAEETRAGVRTCTGQLDGCSLSAGVITARFACSYSSGPTQRLEGSMRLSCRGSNLSASVKTGAFSRNWKLRK